MGRAGGRAAGPESIASTRRSARGGAAWHSPAVTAVGLLVAATYAAWASGTRPFTTPADVAVSIPSGVFAAALVAERRWPDRGPWQRLSVSHPQSTWGGVLWIGVVVLLVGVELVSYFHGGPRSEYPTLSSGLEMLFAHRIAKATGFFAWLIVGWFLVRR